MEWSIRKPNQTHQSERENMLKSNVIHLRQQLQVNSLMEIGKFKENNVNVFHFLGSGKLHSAYYSLRCHFIWLPCNMLLLCCIKAKRESNL